MDWFFLVIYLGFCPAVLFVVVGVVTALMKGGVRKVGRALSLVAGLYFSFTSLSLLYHIATFKGSSDGPGALFVILFIVGSGIGALVGFALALWPGGETGP
jgi:hypothetical protein